MGRQIPFVIGGKTFAINSLEDSLDQAFIDLHAAFFGAVPFNWNRLDQAAYDFLSNTDNRKESHNLYFNNFVSIWNSFLANRNFDEAERIWEMALKPVLEFEASNPGRVAHKGTAYYLWGVTAIKRGDLDKGYMLIHQAVEEDIATSRKEFPDTPAYAFANLNYAKPDQAFRSWVIEQAKYLDARLNKYSTYYERNFTLEDFRAHFLNYPPNTDIAFLFAFTIARLMRLSSAPIHTLKSKFSGQLMINLFFDITLTIEAALKSKNQHGKGFIDHAQYLSQSVKCDLNNSQLKAINNLFKGDFDKTLNAAIQGTIELPDGDHLSKIQSEISVAYGIRNKGAHDVSSSPTIWKKYNEIEQILLNVLFMTVDYVYA